jgi:hypothetical protein
MRHATKYGHPAHSHDEYPRPDMLAWLGAVEAETETRFGNTRKALQLIRHAEGIFATGEPRPSPVWLDWFSPVRLAGFKGNTLLSARQAGPARDTLHDVLEHLPEDSAKQRSVILGDLAAVAVSEDDPERACALAEEALDHLVGYWYATGMARVRAVRESLTQWESLPCPRCGADHHPRRPSRTVRSHSAPSLVTPASSGSGSGQAVGWCRRSGTSGLAPMPLSVF